MRALLDPSTGTALGAVHCDSISAWRTRGLTSVAFQQGSTARSSCAGGSQGCPGPARVCARRGQPPSAPCCISGFRPPLAERPRGAAGRFLRRAECPEGAAGGGGRGEHPLSAAAAEAVQSCRCGSPELVARQQGSINMLCRKCRGSPSCCQREGRRLRVIQDPTRV